MVVNVHVVVVYVINSITGMAVNVQNVEKFATNSMIGIFVKGNVNAVAKYKLYNMIGVVAYALVVAWQGTNNMSGTDVSVQNVAGCAMNSTIGIYAKAYAYGAAKTLKSRIYQTRQYYLMFLHTAMERFDR